MFQRHDSHPKKQDGIYTHRQIFWCLPGRKKGKMVHVKTDAGLTRQKNKFCLFHFIANSEQITVEEGEMGTTKIVCKEQRNT